MEKPLNQNKPAAPKVIQIALAHGSEDSNPGVLILRDDGTVWLKWIGELQSSNDWVEVRPPIQK